MGYPITNAGKVTVKDNRIEWTLKFSGNMPYDDDLEISAPKFFVGKIEWNLRLFPNGKTWNGTKGWIGIALINYSIPSGYYGDSFIIKASVIGGERGEETLKFFLKADDAKNMWHIERKVIERNEFDGNKDRFFRNNTLVIVFEIGRTEGTQTETESFVDRRLLDYKTLLFSGRESDLTIKVKDKEYRVHKDILGSRSPVLSSLLKLDTNVKGPDVLTVEDIDPEIFPEFLHYLYIRGIGRVNLEKVTTLYIVAEKYKIKEFKTECLEYIKTSLSVKTFCDIMIIALKHRIAELKEHATQFFLKNAKAVIATEKWKTFLKEYTDAANELLTKLLESEGKNVL